MRVHEVDRQIRQIWCGESQIICCCTCFVRFSCQCASVLSLPTSLSPPPSPLHLCLPLSPFLSPSPTLSHLPLSFSPPPTPLSTSLSPPPSLPLSFSPTPTPSLSTISLSTNLPLSHSPTFPLYDNVLNAHTHHACMAYMLTLW